MLLRSISRRQKLSLSRLPLQLSRGSFVMSLFVMSVVTATPFLMSNAQAASCKIPKSYYKNVSCTASSGYFYNNFWEFYSWLLGHLTLKKA